MKSSIHRRRSITPMRVFASMERRPHAVVSNLTEPSTKVCDHGRESERIETKFASHSSNFAIHVDDFTVDADGFGAPDDPSCRLDGRLVRRCDGSATAGGGPAEHGGASSGERGRLDARSGRSIRADMASVAANCSAAPVSFHISTHKRDLASVCGRSEMDNTRLWRTPSASGVGSADRAPSDDMPEAR
jgi:hypothetical protein